MGVRSIKMPDVGEGVAEAEIVEWTVKVGDLVKEDQVVAAVMTDKATVEIPTPIAGSVLALGGAVGDVLAVGAELIRIDAPGLPIRFPPPRRNRARSRRSRRPRRGSNPSPESPRSLSRQRARHRLSPPRARPSRREARRALLARSRSPRPPCA